MLRDKISKNELLDLLYSQGYNIEIIKELESDGNYHYIAKFKGRFTKGEYIAGIYSSEFTHEEIKRDCVLKLLQWSGKKVVYALEY